MLTDVKGRMLSGDVKATGLSIIGTKNKELHDKIVRTLEQG